MDDGAKLAILALAILALAVQIGAIDLGFGWGSDRDVAYNPAPAAVETVEYSDVEETSTEVSTPTPTPEPKPVFASNATKAGKCGANCFKIQAHLQNIGDGIAEDVAIEYKLLTGDHLLKEGSADLGDIEPGERVTRSENLSIGLTDGVKLKSNGCVVRSEITVYYGENQDTTLENERKMDCSVV